ncbi:MAG: transcription termination factor Rho, partial [Microbacteriaceae bacterium]|nr:transcription termination factor Rho [Microbacteriaceae bacterium]
MTDTADTQRPLTAMRVAELQQLAAELGIKGAARLRKSELIDRIEAARAAAEPAEQAEAPAEQPAAEQTETAAPAQAETAEQAEPKQTEPK